MRIAMIGAGYVGLVSAACFAEFGFRIECIDSNAERVAALNNGIMPIYEPGLEALVARGVAANRLTFSTDLANAVLAADIVFIAVGTPSRRGDGHADLSYVEAVCDDIGKVLAQKPANSFTVVTTKSTVPVGTSRRVEYLIRQQAPNARFAVCSNPEFLREGAAIEDFMRPDRVVIGAEDSVAETMMRNLYRPLNLNETPILVTGRETAELIKYAGNGFLAMKISFINEMADLCEKLGANVQDVAKGIGLDGRIGRKFLHAGPGYGGSCFPKDTLALSRIAAEAGAPTRLIETTVMVNANRKASMARRIINAMGGDVRGKTIAILGLSFKPNTDDMRDSPALDIIPALQSSGAVIRAHDPAAMHEAAKYLPDIIACETPYAAVTDADAVVILTEWNEFRALDLTRLGDLMRQKLLVDLRNIYKQPELDAAGFVSYGIGRSNVVG